MKRAKKPPAATPPEYPKVFETFGPPYLGGVEYSNREPSCWNGMVIIDKYRITIGKVGEPIEVIRDRLRKLWRETEYNSHHTHPMIAAAAAIGVELDPKERAVGFVRREARVAQKVTPT